MSRRGARVCARPGCPNLQPCPDHGRPPNARWSHDRDGATQGRERRAALARAGYRCERCGLQDPTGRQLQAHHVAPDHVQILCVPCHRAVDACAR